MNIQNQSQMKTLTTHNYRGNRTQKHNDRNFDVSKADHIDEAKMEQNIYWVRNGVKGMSFAECEKNFYIQRYSKSQELQNEKHIASRHRERCRNVEDLLTNKKTAPLETVFELGNSDNRTDVSTTWAIFAAAIKETTRKYGENWHILDAALHADEEGNVHVHYRSIIDYTDKDGIIHIGQEQGLKQMGFDLPDPSKPVSRKNNRRISFDKEFRETVKAICAEYNIEIVQSDAPGGKRLDDYKRSKEAQRLREMEEQAQIAEERVKNAQDLEEQAKANAKSWEEKQAEAIEDTKKEIMLKNKISKELQDIREMKDKETAEYYKRQGWNKQDIRAKEFENFMDMSFFDGQNR